MPTYPPQPDDARRGFTAIPRRTLDMLLCLPLTRRELSVLLLVARLTYGCRDARWARLRQADLAAVGIGANHAGETLEALLSRGLLERDASRPMYRIGDLDRALGEEGRTREARLEGMVAAQVAGSSRNGKVPGGRVPEMGSLLFPKRELSPSRNGNASTVPPWRFDRSQRRFLPEMEAAIDKERQ